jgi:CYTH domain-containing protein
MKYACIERERRFLLAEPPANLASSFNWVMDWYIESSRLRLRRIEAETGEVVARKFTQKYFAPNAPPEHATTTNLYLDEHEFELLRTLGGKPIRKQRFKHAIGEHTFGIDIFHGKLTGLMIAEVEFADDIAMARLAMPDFAIAEVTKSVFFTGGNLVQVTPEVLQRELHQWNATMI